ncbi:dTDP-glucose 4,6-dehydratase [Streptomyces sp. TG1A-60]|uniref:dTDP-glucose 4,6-dehydratase n=1 Tax=Streptomyces sp. TG1A-60 TaxID=3129111 RepID=UPI0030CA8217
MKTTTILVTGGAGFVGSHYVRTLLGPTGPGDISVTVLDKLTYAGNLANLAEVQRHADFQFVRGDICNTELIRKLVAEHDHVVHFAAESHVDRSIVGADAFVRTNVLGTDTLLAAAVDNPPRTFVHVSTDEVYGSIDSGFCTEDQALSPSSPYAAAKASSDLIALAYHRTHGLDVRITRCTNNYGHHQFPEKFIPLFITGLLDGEKVPLYGDGLHIRDWLHIDDHINAIELVRRAGRPGEIYNIGGGTAMTNRELAEHLLSACGSGWDSVEYAVDRKGHDRRYALDYSKIKRELGYRPRRDFATGLTETVQWYRENRPWWEPLKARASVGARP